MPSVWRSPRVLLPRICQSLAAITPCCKRLALVRFASRTVLIPTDDRLWRHSCCGKARPSPLHLMEHGSQRQAYYLLCRQGYLRFGGFLKLPSMEHEMIGGAGLGAMQVVRLNCLTVVGSAAEICPVNSYRRRYLSSAARHRSAQHRCRSASPSEPLLASAIPVFFFFFFIGKRERSSEDG